MFKQKTNKLKPIFAASVLFLAFGNAHASVLSWNIADDFDTINTTNSPWKAGVNLGQGFVQADTHYTVGFLDGNWDVWTSSSSPFGGVMKNNSSYDGFGVSAHQVTMESDGGFAALQWIAPSAGSYNINLQLGGLISWENGGYGNMNTQLASFYIGGVEQNATGGIANQFQYGSTNTKLWNMNNVFLTQGQVIEVNFPSAPINGGNTNTIFNITAVAAVPEPEEWAMMMLGLGMMGFIAKRKKSDNTVSFEAVAA